MTGHYHAHDPHRDVQGGQARAAVFGASDGLVSNVLLIIGVAGADSSPAAVRTAGIAGLVAGAISMASGEYVSVRAHNDLVERELAREREALATAPDEEIAELAGIFTKRGIDPADARAVAERIMEDPEVALEVHAREELGVAPDDLASPWAAAFSSFIAFAIGAVVPLLPWLFGEGTAATWASVILGISGAAVIGAGLAMATQRSIVRNVARHVSIAAGAAAVIYAIGSAVGEAV